MYISDMPLINLIALRNTRLNRLSMLDSFAHEVLMIKNALKLIFTGLLGMIISGCSAQHSFEDVIKDNSLPVTSIINSKHTKSLKLSPQNSIIDTPVYMRLELTKLPGVKDKWIISDIDDHIQEIHLNTKDPNLIIEFAFGKPLVNPSYYLSKDTSINILKKIIGQQNIGTSLYEDDGFYALSITSETGQENFNKLTQSNSESPSVKILEIAIFKIEQIISENHTHDITDNLTEYCYDKTTITEPQYYTAQLKLKPISGSWFKDLNSPKFATASICEGLYKNSQGLLEHNAIITHIEP